MEPNSQTLAQLRAMAGKNQSTPRGLNITATDRPDEGSHVAAPVGRELVGTPELTLRFKKGADGRVVSFALQRGDGSVTVQRNPQSFFAAHDLTHYAVETTLRLGEAFYGLVADGWDFADFGTPWPRGRMPGTQAIIAEQIVGFLDLERTSGNAITAHEVCVLLKERGFEFVLTEEELEQVRELRDSLLRRLQELSGGETLELPFSRQNLAEG